MRTLAIALGVMAFTACGSGRDAFAVGDELQTQAASTLRAEPSVDASAVALVPDAARVTVVGVVGGPPGPSSDWYDVRYLRTTGWISGADLEVARCTQGSAYGAAVEAAIENSFGKYGTQAVQVAHCESGASGTAAVNGQYQGLFQMGSSERETYGDSACAEGQSQAAHAYFADTGSSWGPWSCKPDGG